MFKDILGEAFPIIEKFAPTLASILGSPVSGAAATIALGTVSHIFGLKPPSSTEIINAIKNDPENGTKLSQIESALFKLFTENMMTMPSNIELDVKANWDKP